MDAGSPPDLTRALAGFAAGFSLAAAPPGLLERAKAAILDTVGVIVAGAREEPAQLLMGLAREDGGAPAATALGLGARLPAEQAAEINGVSAHVLDFDDVSRTGFSHSSAVVLPAVLALGEARGASGRAVIEAYIVGIEVTARLGMATGLPHYKVGWHSTSTLGTLAAAAAAAKLLGLDAEATARAMGIALSQAAGSRRNFGTMTKSLHAGHAARCGVHAARLAAAGFEAATDAVEGPSGLLELYGASGMPLEDVLASVGTVFELISPGLGQKRYPCCFATHRAIDAVLDLVARHDLAPRAVEAIAVKVPPLAMTSLRGGRPTSALMAKFSMGYVVAAALFDRDVTLASFSPEKIARPELLALMERIEVGENPELPVFEFPVEQGHVEVSVRTRAGDTLLQRTEHARGFPERPLSSGELRSKFRACVSASLGHGPAERALELLERLESLEDVRALTAALSA